MSTPFSTDGLDSDKFHDECGVFAVFNHEDAAALSALGLHALQHRGQEAAGIVSQCDDIFYAKRALGLVGATFGEQDIIEYLKGNMAIAHNRYATSGDTLLKNVQPLYGDLSFGGMSIAHNGNLTNAHEIRNELVQNGSIFQSTTDSEVIIHLIARSKRKTIEEKVIDALDQIKGAYSLVAMTKECIMGVRDPLGIRPLVLGRLGDAYILASESCALDIINAEYVRDIEPGEMVMITDKGMTSRKPFENTGSRFCIFEYVYFARPDSYMGAQNVYEARKAIGIELAKEANVEGADIIVPIPDSGVPAAIGFAQESGIPFDLGIIRNHYVGRTFIEPTDQIRNLGVRLKHNTNAPFIKGKKVVLVDDSIVRGTTSRKIVEMVRAAGAKEVHMRIASPPTKYSCFYGVDTPSNDKLMAHNSTVEEIAKHIGADSLAYVSTDGLYRAVGESKRDNDIPQYCDACFTGDYAVELTDHDNKTTGTNVTKLRERYSK
ncbi:MAG: amidophosphoribosyltransferase [Alphaproteobacteria bacterium]|nr:amidophosphoribosyltransferase [Alphaproteobacteria bacterium]